MSAIAAPQRSRTLEWGCLLCVLPLLPVLLPVAVVTALWEDTAGRRLRRRFFARWGAAGKRGLLVYSNSPNWQDYVEREWLPRFGSQLVVLNWSERRQWSAAHPLEAAIFRRWAGRREFNPAALVFRPMPPLASLRRWFRALRTLDLAGMIVPSAQEIDVVRFYRPFRDYRHGKSLPLRAAEEHLTDLLAAWSARESTP